MIAINVSAHDTANFGRADAHLLVLPCPHTYAL